MCRKDCRYRASYGDINWSKTGRSCNYILDTGKSRLVIMKELLTEMLNTPEEKRTAEQKTLSEVLAAVEEWTGESLMIPVDTRDRVLQAVLHAYCPCYEPRDPKADRRNDVVWTLDGITIPRAKKEEEPMPEKQQRQKEYEKEYVPPAPEDQLMELYRAGQVDRQIADAVGCRANDIWKWRMIRNLKSNYKCARKLDEKRAMELYQQGLGDAKIAESLGNVSQGAVCDWRRRKKLKPNHTRGTRKQNDG